MYLLCAQYFVCKKSPLMASTIRLMSDDDVEAAAAFDITGTCDLYDPRFGSAGSVELECPTCGMKSDVCLGHHASLSLGTHMFHPLVYKKAEYALNNTCFACFEPLPTALRSKSRKCHACGTPSYGSYSISIGNLEHALRRNNDVYVAAKHIPVGVLPKGYVVSKILVPPIHLRNTEDMEWSSDIQKLYEQLVHLIKNNKYCGPNDDKSKSMTVSAMYTRIVGAAKKEGIIGVMSGKDGIFRKLMMGKRVESCARAVIVGDPHLELDEIAVPRYISDSIKKKILCTKFNIKLLKQLAIKQQLWWEGTDDGVDVGHVLTGMVYEKILQNSDLLLFNRQPSLSRYSLMCFRTKIRNDDSSVFGMNPQVTAPFNADFDGDEMNAFFMESTAEMLELCHLSKCVVDRDKNKVMVVPVQDVVTGCYIMSMDDEPVSNDVWSDCVLLSNTSYADDSAKTTKSLLYMCIPGYDGRKLDKNALTEYVRDTDGQLALDMLQRLQLVVERWLSFRGLTVSLESVVAAPMERIRGETSDAFRERCHDHVLRELSSTDIMYIIESGAKGSVIHASHMAVALGQQYIKGREGIFCNSSYSRGLTPDEFYGHQMAAREGVVSTGVGTASTGYLNRKSCKVLADLRLQYNGTVADDFGISSFTA